MSEIEVTTAQPEPEPVVAPVVEEAKAQPLAETGAKPQGDADPEAPEDGDAPEGDQPKEKKPRGWVSSRFSELTADKKAERARADAAEARAARAEAELNALKGQQQAKSPAADFDTFDPEQVRAEIDRRAEAKVTELIAKREAEAQAKTFTTKITEFQGKISEANEGAQRLLTDTKFPLTDDMAEFIVDSPDGVAVADYLGLNPAESARIASLAPLARGVELARLEARLNAPQDKPKPRLTSAPSPVPTVGARATASADPDKMTQAQYEAWRQSHAPKRA